MVSTIVSAYGFTGTIIQNSDDGTEMNEIIWFESGLQSSLNVLGRDHLDRFDVGLRLHDPGQMTLQQVIGRKMIQADFDGGRLTSDSGILELPEEIVLDFDALDDPLHGNQEK